MRLKGGMHLQEETWLQEKRCLGGGVDMHLQKGMRLQKGMTI
jgi:hypothetical protein